MVKHGRSVKKAAQDMWELSLSGGGAWILQSEEAQERLGCGTAEVDLLIAEIEAVV